MLLVKLLGGLVNQMFEYAFAKNFGDDVQFCDLSKKNIRFLVLNKFNCNVKIYNKFFHPFTPSVKNFTLIKESQQWVFTPELLKLPAAENIVYEGYFQNEKYFKQYRNDLLKEFTPKKRLDKTNTDMLNKINSTTSVSVHIRRTDYVDLNIDTDLEYYKRAIKYITEKIKNPCFFFFSDDMDYVKKNFTEINFPYDYVDFNTGNDCYKDLFLMKNCKHNIIPNSTFSWWAAWLNENPDKIVVCPEHWFKDSPQSDNLLLDSWIRL